MTIQFSHIGESIGTRVLGKQIRMEIEEAITHGKFVTFDFADVKVISHSFADECFGKLLAKWSLKELQSKSTFKNANGFIKKTIAFTLNERLSERELA